MLVSSFLEHFRKVTHEPVEAVSLEAMKRLKSCAWPGNVRELKSTIELSVTRYRGATIQLEDLPADIGDVAEPVVAPRSHGRRKAAAVGGAGENRRKSHGSRPHTCEAISFDVSRVSLIRQLETF